MDFINKLFATLNNILFSFPNKLYYTNSKQSFGEKKKNSLLRNKIWKYFEHHITIKQGTILFNFILGKFILFNYMYSGERRNLLIF